MKEPTNSELSEASFQYGQCINYRSLLWRHILSDWLIIGFNQSEVVSFRQLKTLNIRKVRQHNIELWQIRWPCVVVAALCTLDGKKMHYILLKYARYHYMRFTFWPIKNITKVLRIWMFIKIIDSQMVQIIWGGSCRSWW